MNKFISPLALLALAGSLAFATTTTRTEAVDQSSTNKKIDAQTTGRSPSTTTTVVEEADGTTNNTTRTTVRNRRDTRDNRNVTTATGVRSNTNVRNDNTNLSADDREDIAEERRDVAEERREDAKDRAEDRRDAAEDRRDRANLKADNTGKNTRDRSMEASVTPIDQARGRDSDVATTRKIRSELMQDDSLSTYAKNVKIITLNGVVTLRGPVRSTDERTKIATHARKFVSTNMIVNRLEIAPEDTAR